MGYELLHILETANYDVQDLRKESELLQQEDGNCSKPFPNLIYLQIILLYCNYEQ